MMICRLCVVVMTVLIQHKYFFCFRFLLIRPTMQVCSFPLRVKKGWLMIYQIHTCLHMHQAKSLAQSVSTMVQMTECPHTLTYSFTCGQSAVGLLGSKGQHYIKGTKIEAQITDNKISTFSRQFYTPRLKVRL